MIKHPAYHNNPSYLYVIRDMVVSAMFWPGHCNHDDLDEIALFKHLAPGHLWITSEYNFSLWFMSLWFLSFWHVSLCWWRVDCWNRWLCLRGGLAGGMRHVAGSGESTANNQSSSFVRSPLCALIHGSRAPPCCHSLFAAILVLCLADLVIPRRRIFRRLLWHQPRC